MSKLLLFFPIFAYCSNNLMNYALPNLSDYGFFKNPIKSQVVVEGIISYEIASPLFSDYAEKLRYIKIPKGKIITTDQNDLIFPIGTTIIKTFYYPDDFRKMNSNRNLIETRLLIKTETDWLAIPYVWNEEQTDAYLSIAGDRIPVSWIDKNGVGNQLLYSVPNVNQCKACHVNNNFLQPIGPKIRNLNMIYRYDNEKINQITRWVNLGILEPVENFNYLPRTVNYENENDGSLDQRARAWLDINCAHCHSSGGPAESSGLYLNYEEKSLSKLGVLKRPIAAGRGSGDLNYTIVPGHPELSILDYRIRSIDPGIMMPELSRHLPHKEGIELINSWIKNMTYKNNPDENK